MSYDSTFVTIICKLLVFKPNLAIAFVWLREEETRAEGLLYWNIHTDSNEFFPTAPRFSN